MSSPHPFTHHVGGTALCLQAFDDSVEVSVVDTMDTVAKVSMLYSYMEQLQIFDNVKQFGKSRETLKCKKVIFELYYSKAAANEGATEKRDTSQSRGTTSAATAKEDIIVPEISTEVQQHTVSNPVTRKRKLEDWDKKKQANTPQRQPPYNSTNLASGSVTRYSHTISTEVQQYTVATSKLEEGPEEKKRVKVDTLRRWPRHEFIISGGATCDGTVKIV